MRRSTVVLLLAAALAAAAAPAGAAPAPAASSWTPPASWPVPGHPEDVAPRVAIAPDGTSVAAFERGRAVVVATGDAHGRFGRPRVLGRTRALPPAVAAGPHGAALVAWEEARAIRVAIRSRGGRAWVVRTAAPSSGSAINGVAVARVPGGRGWVLAERWFPRSGSGSLYRVRALRLDAAGRRTGAVQDLGPGFFGIDARETSPLQVSPGGAATLAFVRPQATGPTILAVARAAPGAPFGPPASPADGAGRANAWAAPGNLVASTDVARCGDVGCFGAPVAWRVHAGGVLPRLGGPALPEPGRAFQPTVASLGGGAAVLVFSLKAASAAFQVEAPVAAATVAADGTAGAVQTLTAGAAAEPVALPLSGGRVLAVWSGRRGWGAALAGPDGAFAPTAPPAGPPPAPFHFNATNRDVRTGGRWAAATWVAGARIRVAVRRF